MLGPRLMDVQGKREQREEMVDAGPQTGGRRRSSTGHCADGFVFLCGLWPGVSAELGQVYGLAWPVFQRARECSVTQPGMDKNDSVNRLNQMSNLI